VYDSTIDRLLSNYMIGKGDAQGDAGDTAHVLGELGVLLRSDRVVVFGLPNREGQEGRGSCRSVWIADTIDGLFVY
jgi:hypothetical protein